MESWDEVKTPAEALKRLQQILDARRQSRGVMIDSEMEEKEREAAMRRSLPQLPGLGGRTDQENE